MQVDPPFQAMYSRISLLCLPRFHPASRPNSQQNAAIGRGAFIELSPAGGTLKGIFSCSELQKAMLH